MKITVTHAQLPGGGGRGRITVTTIIKDFDPEEELKFQKIGEMHETIKNMTHDTIISTSTYSHYEWKEHASITKHRYVFDTHADLLDGLKKINAVFTSMRLRGGYFHHEKDIMHHLCFGGACYRASSDNISPTG